MSKSLIKYKKRKNPNLNRIGKTNEEIFGKEKAEEIRIKTSKSRKGRIPWNKGIPWSNEAKQKMRKVKLGTHLSQITKDKISEFNKNKIFSEETRLKISKANTGRKRAPFTEKAKNNMKKAQQLVRKREKEAGITRKLSEKSKEKIRQARLKRVIPTKDTSIEIALQQELEKEGFYFIKHKPIFGQPDIFIEPNICIFADGDYWHNYPKGNPRDEKVNEFLRNKGYIVLRFWERDIKNNIRKCIDNIIAYYDNIGYYYA